MRSGVSDEVMTLTLTLNACENMWPNLFASCSDFPVSVAYNMVAFMRLDNAFPNKLDVNLTAFAISLKPIFYQENNEQQTTSDNGNADQRKGGTMDEPFEQASDPRCRADSSRHVFSAVIPVPGSKFSHTLSFPFAHALTWYS